MTTTVHNRPSLFLRVVPLLLLCPLLVFAVEGAFSFQRGGQNTALGIASQGLVPSMSAGQLELIHVQTYGVYLLCIMLMIPLARSIWSSLGHHVPLILLLILCFSSVLWSRNPLASLLSAVYIAIETAFAIYLIERFEPEDLMTLFIGVGVSAIASSLVMVAAAPRYAVQVTSSGAVAWQGIFAQKNLCGAMVALLLLPAFFLETRGGLWKVSGYIYMASGFVMAYESRSAGALAVTAGCVVFVGVYCFVVRFDDRARVLILGMIVIALGLLGYIAHENSSTILFLVGKDNTLTGRTVIWAEIIKYVVKRPMLGYGLSAFWQGLHGDSGDLAIAIRWTGVSYAESGIFELLLQLGVAGLLLYCALFFGALRDALFCISHGATRVVGWYSTILFYVVISNIEGGKLVCVGNLVYILPIVAFVGLRKEAEKIRREIGISKSRTTQATSNDLKSATPA